MSITTPSEIKEEFDYKSFSNVSLKQKTINFFNNKSDSYLTNSHELVGGKDQEWNIEETIGQNHTTPPPIQSWEEQVTLDYELKKRFEQNPIKINPTQYTSQPELFNAVAHHAKRWQRLSPSTIEHRLRAARRMTKHPIIPINFHQFTYNQFIAYMTYREDVEHAQHFALKNDLNAIKTFLIAYGEDLRNWYYRLPPCIAHKERIIPLPDIVHNIITAHFSNNKYENMLYQYLHSHNFWIGWRTPSEPALMTIDDIHFDTGCIVITEQKKRRSTRAIFPEPAILTGKTRKSIKNWLKWRDKVETSQSGNALYLQPNGRPFTIKYLGKKLRETGKQIYPHYKPYDSRHFCAIARLIKTKLDTGFYDVYHVQKWLGHDKITTTESYIHHAEEYFRIAPYDWIGRTLKFDTIEEESSSKIKTTPKTYVSSGNSPRS
jgi:integrase